MPRYIMSIHFVADLPSDAHMLQSAIEDWIDGVDEPIPVGGNHDFAVVLELQP